MADETFQRMSEELRAVRNSRSLAVPGSFTAEMLKLRTNRLPELALAAEAVNPPELAWRRNPVAWLEQRARMEMWSKQREIFQSLVDHPKTAVHSSHGVGKSLTAAMAVCWWLDVHPPGEAFALSTAPTAVQVKAILWREINKAHARIGLRGRVNLSEWYIGNELAAIGRKPSEHNPTGLHGVHCMDDQHEILTHRGWLGIDDINEDDYVLSPPVDGDIATWMPVTQVHRYDFEGDLNVYDGRIVSFAYTDDHRIPVMRPQGDAFELKKISKIRPRHYILRRTSSWQGITPEVPEPFADLGWDAERFARFVGFWIGDGGIRPHSSGNFYEVILYQTKTQDYVNMLTEGLRTRKGSDFIAFSNRAVATWLKDHVGRHQVTRTVPFEIMDAPPDILTAFCEGLWEADGSKYPDGSPRTLYTTSQVLADQAQEILIKLGRPASMSINREEGTECVLPSGRTAKCRKTYCVSWTKNSNDHLIVADRIKRQHYEGRVWCISTPREMFYTRRHGKVSLSGNSRHMLVVIDEGAGVDKALWDAASTLAANEYGRMLAIGNPDDIQSEFGRVCSPDSGWNVIHIGTDDTPNFTGEEVSRSLSEMLPSVAWRDDRKKAWGEDSAIYRSKVLGLFPTDDSPFTTVPYAWASKCRYAELAEDPHEVQAGIDIGAGGDRTVIYERRGPVAGRMESFRNPDPMQTIGKLVEKINEWGVTRVKVDVIGIGWALFGRLRELSSRHNATGSKRGETTHTAEVVPVNFGAGPSPQHIKRFVNKRAEVWWDIGREYSRLGLWDLSRVDDDLMSELTAPKYMIKDSYGKIQIEAKSEIKSRLGHSPDLADALLLAFYDPSYRGSVSPGMAGSAGLAGTDLLRGLKPI